MAKGELGDGQASCFHQAGDGNAHLDGAFVSGSHLLC